jgi:ribonuclease E
MSKEIYISSTPHETRLAIVESDALTEIYYERENEYTLAGSIYNGKVTRVLPGMQSSFVDIGLERDAFLYITDFLEEAPDSEDFDVSGDANARAPRQENARRDRGPRPDRNAGRSPKPATEPTDEELFTSAVAGLDETAAPAPSERGDRNSRRGGRGRRDRRPDKPGDKPEGIRPPIAAPVVSEEPVSFMQAGPSTDEDQVGEGAPGADGSRRWRGRRGRRGGRGPGNQPQREGSTPTPAPLPEPSVDLYAAEAPAAPATPAPVQQPRNGRGPREGRDRNDRGPRDNRGERGREGREGRAPREFAPREPEAPVYGREVYADAPAEPIILPGESLSKYRPASEQSAQAAPSSLTPLPPPSSEFKLAENWDGGLVLPGESLSRRKPSSSTTQARHQAPAPVSRFAAPVAEPVPQQVHTPAPIAAEIPPVAEPAFAAEQHQVQAPVEEPQEYEPIDASASYRVDPVAPSEYRQTAPVLEPEAEVHAPAPEVHELTSIQETGEMLSEPLPEAAAPALHESDAPVHTPVEAAPETSVSHLEAGMEMHTTHVPPPPIQHFEPGSGDLHEEELEDEEFEIPSLHASSVLDEDLDEQETLEGAADLGTMLREMSIDEMTGPAGDDEDDDLEEDFIEEDQELAFDVDDEGGDDEEAEEFEDEDGAEESELTGDGNAPELAAQPHGEAAAPAPRRDHPGREGRKDGRRNDRGRREGRSGRSGGGERSDSDRGPRRDGGRGGRQSAQMTNLPAISDLLKPGQEILVQIAKEPIAKKGARITSHIALPGRFLVFMPTVGHTGVSRKIESDQERRRLKEILLSEKGEASGGFIVRTAADGASEEELRSDLRFLLNLWTDIKARSESSKSPALIYHDLNLVERVLRDQVTDNFSAIWVDTESQYEQVLRFLQRFQPSLIRRVKLYTKETPLFEQFGITEEINKALRSKVWLKSGGSIVINQTEALVAIDINTGKYVGKTARLEDTIVKTNLDAIPEIVRQIRLRDLGGIIIIDFIDMDERKNRNKVMAALEEELKSDRAPSKVLQFNDFGLVAITRKRVKQSLERTLSTTCGVCAGTGMVKSPVTVCNEIYIEMRKMHKHLDRGDVMLRVHPEVVKQLKVPSTHWLQDMEEMVGKTILVKSDPSLHPEQFDIH